MAGPQYEVNLAEPIDLGNSERLGCTMPRGQSRSSATSIDFPRRELLTRADSWTEQLTTIATIPVACREGRWLHFSLDRGCGGAASPKASVMHTSLFGDVELIGATTGGHSCRPRSSSRSRPESCRTTRRSQP